MVECAKESRNQGIGLERTALITPSPLHFHDNIMLESGGIANVKQAPEWQTQNPKHA